MKNIKNENHDELDTVSDREELANESQASDEGIKKGGFNEALLWKIDNNQDSYNTDGVKKN